MVGSKVGKKAAKSIRPMGMTSDNKRVEMMVDLTVVWKVVQLATMWVVHWVAKKVAALVALWVDDLVDTRAAALVGYLADLSDC